jgi:hypothetical protein
VKTPAYIVAAVLMLAPYALPQQAAAHLEETEESVMFEELDEPCTPDEVNLEIHVENEVTFVSGGIGFCESQEMRRISHEYQLELLFLEKTTSRESFLAGVPVQITDSKGSLAVDTITKGPLLLAKMPAGRYVITATYDGIVKTHHLRIDNMHQRVVFSWRTQY